MKEMKFTFKYSTTKWFGKSKAVRHALASTYSSSLEKIAKDVYKRSQANLKGPHYKKKDNYRGPGTGKMPVPRVTGTLARSLKITKLNAGLWVVFADSKVAKYAIYVHEGTRKMQPRRFIGDVVTQRKGIYLRYLKMRVKAAIRSVGTR